MHAVPQPHTSQHSELDFHNVHEALPDMPVQVMMEMMDQPIHFHPWCAKLAGSALGGLWLSYALRKTQRLLDPMTAWDDNLGMDRKPFPSAVAPEDAWFEAPVEKLTIEMGMSKFEQQSAKRVLKNLGLIEERFLGLPAIKEYRVNTPHMMGLLQAHIQSRSQSISSATVAL
jgi:hypothetical protein